MSTDLKVKQVQAPEDPKVDGKMEDDFQVEVKVFDDLYATDIGSDNLIIGDELIEAFHPNLRIDREDKNDEEDDQGPTQTFQFASIPPVVVNNYTSNEFLSNRGR